MPVVLTVDGFRFVIYFNDHGPPHVHVKKAECRAKVEILTAQFINNRGYNPREQKRIQKIIQSHRETLINAWNETHGEE